MFSFSYDELKSYQEDFFQHTIPLKPECQKAKPFRQKLRQINPKLAPIVKKELEKMLAAGIIAPTKHLTWCYNLVVVRKKKGSLRDMHRLQKPKHCLSERKLSSSQHGDPPPTGH